MNESIYITKAQLHDYVSKFEFKEFVAEMRDFREETNRRFDQIDERFVAINVRFTGVDSRLSGIDKRLDVLDRRMDSLKEEFRVQTGVMLQEMRTLSQATMEYLKHIDSRLTALENKIS